MLQKTCWTLPFRHDRSSIAVRLPAESLQHIHLSDTEVIPYDIWEVEAEAVALLCCESLSLPGAEFSRGYVVVVLMLWSRVKGAGLLGFDSFQRNINERARRAVVRFTPQRAIEPSG